MEKEQTSRWEEEFDNEVKIDKEFQGTLYKHGWIKNFISKTISQEREKCIKEEVFAFMHHLQEKANTLPPNLLLNEVVNYAYDRINRLQK